MSPILKLACVHTKGYLQQGLHHGLGRLAFCMTIAFSSGGKYADDHTAPSLHPISGPVHEDYPLRVKRLGFIMGLAVNAMVHRPFRPN